MTKWCNMCGCRRPSVGGHLRQVLGLRIWVCSKHPRTVR